MAFQVGDVVKTVHNLQATIEQVHTDKGTYDIVYKSKRYTKDLNVKEENLKAVTGTICNPNCNFLIVCISHGYEKEKLYSWRL